MRTSVEPGSPAPGPGPVARRTAGVAVLVIAVLAVVVVARIGGTRVAGTAIAPPGLRAPTVGDCVAAFADPAHAAPPVQTPAAVTAGSADPRPLPQVGVVDEGGVTFGGCTGDHLGEVIAYRRMAQQWRTDADRSRRSGDGPVSLESVDQLGDTTPEEVVAEVHDEVLITEEVARNEHAVRQSKRLLLGQVRHRQAPV